MDRQQLRNIEKGPILRQKFGEEVKNKGNFLMLTHLTLRRKDVQSEKSRGRL